MDILCEVRCVDFASPNTNRRMSMRVECYLSEDEMKIAIAKWFQSLSNNNEIKPDDVIISHCTSGTKDTYGASVSYEKKEL